MLTAKLAYMYLGKCLPWGLFSGYYRDQQVMLTTKDKTFASFM